MSWFSFLVLTGNYFILVKGNWWLYTVASIVIISEGSYTAF